MKMRSDIPNELLQELVQDTSHLAIVRLRARCILLALDGKSPKEIADLTDSALSSIYRWISNFNNLGVQSITDNTQHGGASYVMKQDEPITAQRITAYLELQNKKPTLREIDQFLRNELNIRYATLGGVHRLLQRLGFRNEIIPPQASAIANLRQR